MASSEILISSSLLVAIFITNNFGIASDFSPLIIKLSKKSKFPITVSFFAGINSSDLPILSFAHRKIL